MHPKILLCADEGCRANICENCLISVKGKDYCVNSAAFVMSRVELPPVKPEERKNINVQTTLRPMSILSTGEDGSITGDWKDIIA